VTTAEFLLHLQQLGIQVSADNDSIRCRAPRGALTPELRDEVARRKMEIVALLGRGDLAKRSQAAPLERVARDGDLPLSFGQERLWFLHQMTPDNGAYNIASSIRFRPAAAVDLLARALQQLTERHETLRTTFVTRDGQPFVRIDPSVAVALPVFDLRAMPEAVRAGEADRIRREHAAAPFDLEAGPLMHAAVLQSSDRECELLLALHHSISDRWSLGVVANELQAICAALVKGTEPALAELPLHYVDFAAWQRQRLERGLLEEQLAYWRERLGGDLSPLDLPTDRPRPAQQTYAGAWESRTLPADTGGKIARLSRESGVTPFMVFVAAFDALLHAYTRQTDVTVGTPVSGRTNRLLEGVVGCFLNMLVLRVDLDGDPSFAQLLDRVREVALGAYSHADVPFEKLVADLQPRRDTSRSPLFQVAISFQSAPRAVEVPEDVTALPGGGTLFDITLFVTEVDGQLTLTAEYNVDLFDRSTIARMLGHLDTLLGAALDDPSRRLSELPVVTADERRQLILDVNQTGQTFDRSLTLDRLISRQAARTPHRLAVSCGDDSYTYDELDARSNQLAHCLRRRGVGAEAAVGLCVERSADMVVGLLGILKAGGAYVPLDPSYPTERLVLMLEDAGVKCLVTQEGLADLVPGDGCEVICLDRDWPDIAGESSDPVAPVTTGESLAYVIYTSGSTGRPKGVQVPHRAVVNLLTTMAARPGLSADDILVAVTTLSFDIAGLELWLPLAVGAQVVIATREQTTDGGELQMLLEATGATVVQATPATWRLLAEAGWRKPGFRMLSGGEALPRDLGNELLSRGGELWNLYGPTETTVWSSIDRVEADAVVTIGRPIANTQLYILDDHLRPAPTGIPGELYIGGDGVTRGYRGRPDLTADRFVPNPFGPPGARMYRTGDLARFLPDGRVECLGRLDHQVKVRGFRIELGEVEGAMLAHDAVAEAVAYADELAPGDRRLIAYIVCRTGESATVSELRRFLRARLPEYMVPSFFVHLDRLPRTPNGKIDRRLLPRPFATTSRERERVAPQTPTERRLAEIWQQTLGVPSISADDNFFDVGGHSLLSMRVLAAIEKELGCHLNPRVMFLESLKQTAAQCDRLIASAIDSVLVGSVPAPGITG
jgi:amino acid adenylation domain-containing protein